MKILTTKQKNVPTTSRWQSELKSAFRDIDSLLKYVGLQPTDLPGIRAATKEFPLLVPRSFANRMRFGKADDPLLAQVIGSEAPNLLADHATTSWTDDPVSDKSFEKVPGVLHKYPGRVLLLLTGACAIHCRYCFRQNFDYSTTQLGTAAALEYLRKQESVTEVILSGGDPLLRTDGYLKELLVELDGVSHLRRLRIHSRTPVVLPSRVTEELLAILAGRRLMVSLVLHINHVQEIDAEVQRMIEQLRSTGILVLNQSVLLQGVNADVQSQFQLCEKLIDLGVVPYYLHLLDRVKGAENYLVADQVGIRIIEDLQKMLPGYGVPRLVREVAGEASKTAIK